MKFIQKLNLFVLFAMPLSAYGVDGGRIEYRWSYSIGTSVCGNHGRYTSGGPHPAKVGIIYLDNIATPTPPPPPPNTCCPDSSDPNFCSSMGGWTDGNPDPDACESSGGSIPNDIAIYKNTTGGCAPSCTNGALDYSSSAYNGSSSATYSQYFDTGSTVTNASFHVGYFTNKGGYCPGGPSGYCFGGYLEDHNFPVVVSTSVADCGVWKQTNIDDCGMRSVTIYTRYMPAGGCPVPTLLVSPNGIDFGAVTVGETSATQTLSFSNTSVVDASSCVASLSGTNSSEFNIVSSNCSSSTPCTIPGNSSAYATVNVVANASSAGSKSASVTMTCSGPGGGNRSATLTATASNPLPPPVAGATWTTSALNLNSVMFNALPSTEWPVKFTNSGTGDAGGCTFQPSDTTNFEIVSNTCPGAGITIPKNTECNIRVKIKSTIPAASFDSTGPERSTYVNLNCSGPESNKMLNTSSSSLGSTVKLSFKAFSEPNISFSLDSRHLTDTMKTETSAPPETITISNTGGWDATGCVVSATDTTQFVWTGLGPCNLPKGGYCTVTVAAKPTTTGTKTSELKVTGCTAAVNGKGPYDKNSNSPHFWYEALPLQCSGGQYEAAGGTSGFCQCPDGYEWTAIDGGGSACRPIVPSAEFYKKDDSFSKGYPVCGVGRVPVSSSLNTITIASSSMPESSNTHVYDYPTPNFDFKYTVETNTTNGADPPTPHYIYQHWNLNRCACSNGDFAMGSEAPGIGAFLTPTITSGSDEKPRFASDYYEVISNLNVAAMATATPFYGQVAIARDNLSNGYLGSIFGQGSSVAACGCPNINEVSSALDSSGDPSGQACHANLDTSDATTRDYMMLAKFDPTSHGSQVIDVPNEVKTSGGTTGADIIRTIMLPTTTGGYQKYDRRIWTCAPPTKLDTTSKRCVWTRAENKCDEGNGTIPVSPISPRIETNSTNFQAVVNKKLACCMNAFDRTNRSDPLKYDCVDNSSTTYSNFDALWKSTDDANDGGQNNAVILTNANGQPITGFYTLSGQRCSEFSEFGGALRDAKVNQVQSSGQQASTGGGSATAITYGSYNETGVDPLKALFASKIGKGVPTTAAQMRRCPILVRAAMTAKCPEVSPSSATTVRQTFDDGSIKHCLTAESIKIHLRAEQIYEIQGLPKMKPIDSIMDPSQTDDVSVTDLITSKTVGICPAGSRLQSDGSCAF